jgi:hypothetical protein
VGDTTKLGPETAPYMDFVHAAVYDAVVGIHRRYEPYDFYARAPYAQATRDAAYAGSLAGTASRTAG